MPIWLGPTGSTDLDRLTTLLASDAQLVADPEARRFGELRALRRPLDEDVERGVLVRVLPDVAFPPSPIRALWLGPRRPSVRVRAFVDGLVECHVA